MELTFNGEKISITTEQSLFELLESKGISGKKGIAVAVNNEVISREKWNSNQLSQNDSIIVITAAAGG